MPITNYSVLRGTPSAGKIVSGSSIHYQITVGAFTVAVNIESSDGSEVLYAVLDRFTPPDAQGLLALPVGMNKLRSAAGGLALDFVREQIHGAPMITRAQMTLLPRQLGISGHKTSLENAVSRLLARTIAARGEVYAFGSAYADQGQVDGIHDIHMNQGNPVNSFGKDNGTWQDGALFLYGPSAQVWTAIFIAFQSQTWSTDNAGNPAA